MARTLAAGLLGLCLIATSALAADTIAVGTKITPQNWQQYKDLMPQGLQVVASAIDPMSNMKVPDFIKQFQPGFPVGFNEHNAAIEYLQHPIMYRLMMPQLVFIDRKGTIRAQRSGDEEAFFNEASQEKNLREAIEGLLKEPTQTANKKRASR